MTGKAFPTQMSEDVGQLKQVLSKFNSEELEQSQRLLHGRGRCYPGYEHISIDWFAPVILLTQYKQTGTNIDIKDLALNIVSVFRACFPEHPLDALVFQDRSQAKLDSKVLFGNLPEQVYAQEYVCAQDSQLAQQKLRYQVDLLHYQNVGFFLDARGAREYLVSACQQKRILNLFSFTCAFSVCALAHGAQSVVNLDMGKGVLERGKRNHELNGLDLRSVHFIKSNIFKAWKKLHKYGRYDLVMIDPPSFQKGSFEIERDYPKVVRQLSKLLAFDAEIIACLNSPFLTEAFLDDLFLSGELNNGVHRCTRLHRLNNPEAFKDVDAQASLKVVVYRYQRLNQDSATG